MSVIGHSPLAGASGAAGGADPLYVDDVFSTFLYDGNGSTQTINNGIDVSGEGGLVWLKNRTNGYEHSLFDTARGAGKYLVSNASTPEATNTNRLSAFNSNGFSLGNDSITNDSGNNFVSWTFRKAAGFFDIVTYSGTGSAQNISHTLGSVPGMIMIHCRDGNHDWEVYHRETGATKSLHLNKTDAAATDSTVWNNTTPTSSVFTVGTSSNVNQNGHGYVAYVFAHDEQSFGTNSDEVIIKCGSYTGAANTIKSVSLGFEPQWLIIKNTSRSSDSYGVADWWMGDIMRQMSHSNARALRANTNAIEYNGGTVVPTATGFNIVNQDNIDHSTNGDNYIYMAIRRPHKPATAATDVFTPDDHETGNVTPYFKTSGHRSDFVIFLWPTANFKGYFISRITGKKFLITSEDSLEGSNDFFVWDYMNGMQSYTSSGDQGYNHLSFKRSPGFCDVVAYTGNGTSGNTVQHNLEVAPELMFVKARDRQESWAVYSSSVGATGALYLNSTGDVDTGGYYWNDTAPTAQQFSLGNLNAVNRNTTKYMAFLFASQDGISKIGSYTGSSGSNVDVDCGFTSGARFVLIKRTNGTGDWFLWDTARGIVSGNDPYMRLNVTGQEVTGTDYIDPLNAGFTVTSSAPSALNTSGGTYLFFAIA